MGPPRLQQQRYQEPGTGWGGESGISYSNGPRWGGGGEGWRTSRQEGRVREGWGDGGWGGRSGRILQAIPDGDVVEEGQPHGGSLGVSTRGREGPTADSVVMRTVTGGFIIGREGAQQMAGLSNIDVRNFSQRDHLASGEGLRRYPWTTG